MTTKNSTRIMIQLSIPKGLDNINSLIFFINYRIIIISRYVALVSGLELGGPNDDLMAMQLLIDLLAGQLGDEDQQRSTANVVKLIVAGNSLSSSAHDSGATKMV